MAATNGDGNLRALLLVVLSGSAIANQTRIFAQTDLQSCPKSASVDGNVTPAVLTQAVQPQYPEVARTYGVDGNVSMDVVIAADGSVRDAKVTHGLPQLIPNAVNSAEKWRYDPARINGVAIACRAVIKMNFQIAASAAEAAAANAAVRSTAATVPPDGVLAVRPILPPPPDGVLRVSSKAMETQLQTRIEPMYPVDAIALDARGKVFVLLTVSKSGEVMHAQALTGPERFRIPAIDAVKQWKFRPYEVEGEAREVQTMVILNFAPPR